MKKIVIDGHNLIPKLPGINLADMDDELHLLGLIQEYCRLARRQAELFFDGAPNASSTSRMSGLVRPHYIKIGRTADDSIIAYLQKSGKETHNLLVVSSDRRIQSEARSLGAEVMTSDAFAVEMKRVLSSTAAVQELREKKLSDGEVEEWTRLFSQNSGKNKNS